MARKQNDPLTDAFGDLFEDEKQENQMAGNPIAGFEPAFTDGDIDFPDEDDLFD